MKSKKIRDVLEGRDYRAQITVFLNERVLNNEARVEFVHAYWRLLMPMELKKKNIFTNRIQPHSGRDNAVGLDCLLSASWTDVKIPLVIRRKVDPDLYYKLPGDIEIERDSFIHVYLNNAYFLLLDGETDPARSRKYALVKGNQFRWWQSESKGNENRISAVKRNGRLIIPQRDLLWVNIFGYGFWRDELLDLRSALLNLLHGE